MQKEFSIVIPVFNEQESLGELTNKIKKAFEDFGKSYEIIFVDDGSTDKSLSILKVLESNQKQIRILSLRKNLGKSAALMLGFQKAIGKFIVMLDADLQDDPNSIKSLYQALKKNDYDIVSGWRKTRRDSKFKVASSLLFNKIVSILFGMEFHDLNSSLKIFKSEAAKKLRLYGGMHRFIPIMAQEEGFRVGEKEVIHHARKYGESKYKPTKILTEIPDLITMYFLTRYNRRPLHFFGKIGGLIFTVGFFILIYLSYLRFSGEKIGGRPLLLFGVLLIIAGLQIIFTGLLADLIVNLNNRETEEFPVKYESQDKNK